MRAYAVQPTPGEKIPGLRRVETGIKWVRLVEVDGVVDVTLEEAVEGVLKVARREGLLIGLSSGAVVAVLGKLSEKLAGDVVLIFPDSGFKYVEQLSRHLR